MKIYFATYFSFDFAIYVLVFLVLSSTMSLAHYHLSFLSVTSNLLLKILLLHFFLKEDPQPALSFCYTNSLYLVVISPKVRSCHPGLGWCCFHILAFPEGFPLTALPGFRVS